ncbi:MAG TPA: DNA-processing protein DprA [Candidatus Cybelea sp.]|nr:DNA-processing protein DprA [Candidatus Cybelea sp.]
MNQPPSGMGAAHVRGSLPRRGIAIVGSRTPPAEAETFAYDLARNLGEPIVSGLAPGIDVAAHRGALRAGVPTVAFLAYGFGAPNPPEVEELERAIVAGGGAVATLLPPGTPVSQETSIARDRLQAEHARAVVLICSEIDGGAMHAMRFAKQLEKPRFAVMPPEEVKNHPEWAGNLACIAGGATPLPFNLKAVIDLLRS